jgi:peptidoglycan/xylan/chitin deacetylase (PgdA/CDA1 family)
MPTLTEVISILITRMKSSLPILMYHGIKTDRQSVPEGRELGAELYDVSLEQFAAQMTWLSDNNYQTINIDEINNSIQPRQVVLTFDDGEMNNFIHAFPVLQRLKLTAYFFVIVNRVGTPGYMGWDELRQLQESGMKIGSHGLTHRILTSLTDREVEAELAGSLQCLVNHLGDGINTLSIPRGFCDDRIIQIADKLGYQNVFISKRPDCLESNCWERIAVKTAWNIQRIEQAIDGIEPIHEQIIGWIKATIEKSLGGAAYDRLRNTAIRIYN